MMITAEQVRLHRASEVAAVFLAAPLLFYVAFVKSPPTWARVALALVATSTILIDGYLLTKWS